MPRESLDHLMAVSLSLPWGIGKMSKVLLTGDSRRNKVRI